MTQERGPGDLIDDRFRLIERLGSGAMGAVWLALDEVLQREVALKQVRPADPGLATDPEYAEMLRTRVLREARALARIQHPHVVTIHHVVVIPGESFPWLVMELVRGGTLDDRLVSGPMQPAEAAELGRGLLGALRAAHAAGICHRDVKPANVLLRPDGSPVLTDFGIADLADTSRLTATGGLTGSPAYIAPERLHGSEGDPASDLWSLGMLLYVAVEGRHPLRRTTAAATLAAVMAGIVPTAERAGRLEPALHAALTADPSDRASAEDLDALLVRAIDQPPPFRSAAPSRSAAEVSATASPEADSTDGPVPASPETDSATVLRVPRERDRPRSRAVVGGLAVLLAVALVAAGVALGPRISAQITAATSPGSPSESTDGPATDPTETRSGTPSSASAMSPSPAATQTPTPSPSAAAKTIDLLTEDGVAQVIKAFEKVAGTTRFSELVIYDEHAVAQVPVKGRKKAVDAYIYRDGKAEPWRSGADDTDGSTIDAAKINWKILPRLLKRANKTLKVPEPETRYVILDADSPFNDGEPTLFLYLTDTYGGGYLKTDLKGRVLDTNPAG